MKRQLFKKIMSGLLSLTMLLTMVPDIWMPVHADVVRNEIIQTDTEKKQEKPLNTQSFLQIRQKI